MDTEHGEYSQRLIDLQTAWWKRIIPVQAPYRWNLRRLNLGFTLEIGSGIGRNLINLGGRAVGIDHNADAVAFARGRGLESFTPQEFLASPYAHSKTFDSLLAAHLIEHLESHDAAEVLRPYLPFLRDSARIVLITPQERGYSSDPTHRRFVDFAALRALCEELDLSLERQYSFPFPRAFGRVFVYNEFVCVARVSIKAAA